MGNTSQCCHKGFWSQLWVCHFANHYGLYFSADLNFF